MTVHSSGLLLYRWIAGAGSSESSSSAGAPAFLGEPGSQGPDPTRETLEVLLVHPGGPFYYNKDDGSWSVPKGEYDPDDEDALDAARREFAEETGATAPSGLPIDLGWIEQRAGKIVHAFAFDGGFDPASLRSNEFEMEWPRGSGQRQRFPEVDRADWFDIPSARGKILPPQRVFLDRLAGALSAT